MQLEQQPGAASADSEVSVTAELYMIHDDTERVALQDAYQESSSWAPFRGELPTRPDPYSGKGAGTLG